MSETSPNPNSLAPEKIKSSAALTVHEKLILQRAVMESYGIHHDQVHPGNPLSIQWVEGQAAKAFSDLLDEQGLSPADVEEVEIIKSLTRGGNLAEAVRRCHVLLSKKFEVELSLKAT